MRQANRSIIWRDYGDWLLDKVNFRRKGYSKLMNELFDITFTAINPHDENRIEDAISLREEFLNIAGINGGFDREVNVLEVLVALAIRIEDEYIGDPGNPDPSYIFWEMCCNLELDFYTDVRFSYNSIHSIVEPWVLRDFEYDGEGSIFPIKHPIQDQRRIEIWSQMQEYLSENYS